MSASSYSPNTSKEDRSVPLKMVGSSATQCYPASNKTEMARSHSRGMIVSLLRKSVRPSREISNPSMTIWPCTGSTKRGKDSASVLLPDPVRPKMPIFSPGRTVKHRSCRTSGKLGSDERCVSELLRLFEARVKERHTAYLTVRFSHEMLPSDGHDAGGRCSESSGGS